MGIAFSVTFISCKKGIKDPVTLDKAAGHWNIHGVRYYIYYGTPEPKDSTVPNNGKPINYVNFDGESQLQYCFNSYDTYPGQYAFMGSDSISININNETTKWKIMLLTSTNFNIQRTLTDKSNFPGASEVIMYQGFIK